MKQSRLDLSKELPHCAKCIHSSIKKITVSLENNEYICCLHPPVICVVNGNSFTHYPEVNYNHCCGDGHWFAKRRPELMSFIDIIKLQEEFIKPNNQTEEDSLDSNRQIFEIIYKLTKLCYMSVDDAVDFMKRGGDIKGLFEKYFQAWVTSMEDDPRLK